MIAFFIYGITLIKPTKSTGFSVCHDKLGNNQPSLKSDQKSPERGPSDMNMLADLADYSPTACR